MGFSKHDVDWATSECQRQQTSPRHVLYLLEALDYARNSLRAAPGRIDVQMLASLIEPDLNKDYRTTPAVFNQGEPAIKAELIQRQMDLWYDQAQDPHSAPTFLAKWLLEIHPYRDGNGRLASVVWNWLWDTLQDPQPLPYFFGEKKCEGDCFNECRRS